MRRLTLSLSGLIASIGVALLPLLVVPLIGVVAEDQKGPMIGLVLGVALVVGAVVAFVSRGALASRAPTTLSFIGIPLVAVAGASALVNGAPSVVWFGEAMEWGTVVSYAVFAFAIILASQVPARLGRLTLYIYVSVALFVGVVSAIASIVSGNSGILSNWPTISAAVALALVCVAALADWSGEWGDGEWVLALGSAALFVCVLLFFNIVYVSAAAVALLVSVIARAALFSTGRASRLPVLSFLLLLGLVASIVLGMRNPVLPVQPDLRPSLEATRLVSGPIFVTNLTKTLVGAGPESFGQVWNRYRPQEFNQTPLWNTTFKEGNSTASTILVELGVFGIIAWLLPLIVAGILVVRRARDVSVVTVACFSIALVYYVASFFYTTGLVSVVLCGVVLGLLLQTLRSSPEPVRSMRLPLRLVVGVLLLVSGVTLVVVSLLQLTSLHYRMVGIKQFEAGEYAAAHVALSKGVQYWPTPRLYANDANVLLAILRETAASSTPPVEMINKPINAVSQAFTMDRNDLTVSLTRASVYVVLVSVLKISDVEGLATSSIDRAAKLAPNRPEAPYLQALLSAHLGRLNEARTYVAKALMFKSDYQPAADLQKQLAGL